MKRIFLGIILGVTAMAAFAAGKEREMTIMTYNLRFGELASMERLAQEINAANPDFVALQEVAVNTMREM
ncbi:MAG: endonuclease/exonuclease/phosphatase family protein, partial [Muribaculaceae bacterium]|nr:endonuclease/exonuclease/phosphatase family protein [Muribaculaceae bacterium]